MVKFDLQVGMAVYLKPTGNEARHTSEIKKHIVKKVGRKYFETWDGEREISVLKFRLENFQQENGGYISNWSVYQSEQDILDEREADSIHSFFKHDIFGGWGNSKLTLDQLRRMKAIAEEANNHA